MFLSASAPFLAVLLLLSDFNRTEAPPSPLTDITFNRNHHVPTWTGYYVAVPGDTVSKLARLHLGANTKANRDAIIALNPSLQKNPNLIVVGKTYLIPPRHDL